MEKSLAVVIHNIRSAHNVGSIFRTADGAGFARVVLTGYTPAPTDRFGRSVKEIAKTALGAEKVLPWEQYATLEEAVAKLKGEGYAIVGLEQDGGAVDYREFVPPASGKVALVVGSEVEGLLPEDRELCDALIEIPMHGKKESLNVSVAFGIAAYQLSGYKK